MAAHAHLKNEFTEDEKYHNLMTWLSLCYILLGDNCIDHKFSTLSSQTSHYILKCIRMMNMMAAMFINAFYVQRLH